jgi:hypothetical protein
MPSSAPRRSVEGRGTFWAEGAGHDGVISPAPVSECASRVGDDESSDHTLWEKDRLNEPR